MYQLLRARKYLSFNIAPRLYITVLLPAVSDNLRRKLFGWKIKY
jgi:hypothetical protein